MSERLAEKLVSMALRHEVIQEEDRELYLYSYQITVELLFSWTSILLIGLIMGRFVHTLVYMATYIPMRWYAGGYHARTFLGCYSLSVATYLAFCFVEPYFSLIPLIARVGIILASGVVIVWLAPIADPNKPMEPPELVQCAKRIKVLVLAYSAVLLALSFALPAASSHISFACYAFVSMALSLIAVRKNKAPLPD